MKRFLFFSLMLLAFTACKDDEDVQPEETVVGKTLRGTWTNNMRVSTYINSSEEVAYQDSNATNVIFEFDGANLHISHPGVEGRESYVYALSDTGSSNYITFRRNGAYVDHYQILNIGDSTMTWKDVIRYASYTPPGGEQTTSRRGEFIYRFKRQ